MNLSFEQYLNIRWAGGASFRHDGRRAAFLTDVTGTAQVWTLDAPQSWPEQLTFFQDRVTFARYSPTEPIIAFGKDTGGNEDQLIYMVADDGGAPQRLSVADAKHLWGAWSPDGRRIAWTHNGRNGRDFDVYVYDLASGEERLLLEADGYWFVEDWFHDGTRLLVGRADSNVNDDLYELSIADGSLRLLTEHEGRAIFATPVISTDDETIWLATNLEGDFTNLATLDVATAELQIDDPDATWDVEELALSDDGRHLLVARNEEGYTRLHVHDLETEIVTEVDGLPRGVAGGFRPIPGTPRFGCTVHPCNDSVDVWELHPVDGSSERWTRSAMAGVPRSSLVEPELVEYPSFDDLKISGFFWKPETPPPYPVVVDIHGGPEGQRRPTMSAVTQYYVQRGLAVFAPNVRGSRGYGKHYMSLDDVRRRMDSVADIEATYRWLVDHGGADPGRIALTGGSYGGFMVLSSMVTYPDLWAAGVDIVGVANFVTFLENTSDYRRHLREAEYGSLENDREFLHEISPLTHIDKIDAPLMVIHGRNDPRVPVSEAEQVVESCRKKGLPVESIIYEDEGHGLAKRANRLDAWPRVLDFLAEHLSLD